MFVNYFKNIIKRLGFRCIIGGVKHLGCANYKPKSLIYAVLSYLGHSAIFFDFVTNSLASINNKRLVKCSTGKESPMLDFIN